MTNQPVNPVSELIILDGAVQGIAPFLADLPQSFQVIALDPLQDGLGQIAQALADFSGLAAIHVISHGAPGSLNLGSTLLDLHHLSDYAQELHGLGQALMPGGDILLYGCNVGQGDAGATFLRTLSSLTGADVAASTDLTGVGGDWVLEAHTGSIGAGTLMPGDDYAGTLVATNTAPRFQATGNGKLITDFGGQENEAVAVTLQDDGKIVVAGKVKDASGDWDFALARYNSDGTLDTGFGVNGLLTTQLGASHADATSLAVQADGKIVVGGSASNGLNSDFALARYNGNGSLDATFGTNGLLLSNFLGGSHYLEDIQIQDDGRIVAAGGGSSLGEDIGFSNFILARYTAGGTLDASFDGDGYVGTSVKYAANDLAYSAALASDGKIVAGGVSGSTKEFALARYNGNGSLDLSFNLYGKLNTSITSGEDIANAVLVQPDGKIVAAGYSWHSTLNGYDFTLVRYNSNGSLDSGFDGDGKLTLNFGNVGSENGWTSQSQASWEFGYAAALHTDGRILVVGSSDPGSTADNDFALARFNPDGSLDSSFDGDTLGGTVAYAAGGAPVILAHSLTLDDVELNALSGGVGAYRGATLTLARKGGANAADSFSFDASSQFSVSGNSLKNSGGYTFATFTASGGSLTLSFDSYSTRVLVNDVLEHITYSGSGQASATPVEIVWTFSDGNTGSQGIGGALSATASSFVRIVAAGKTLTGTSGNNALVGGAGNDSLSGLAGNDTLNGGGGNDTLNGGGGDDLLTGGQGDDVLDGGLGNDTASYAAAAIAVDVFLNLGTAYGAGVDTLIGIERLVGSAFDDLLVGNGAANQLSGGGGVDFLQGQWGADKLFGQAGNDVLEGGAGNDTLIGGAGTDTLTGGTGKDSFLFNTTLRKSTNVDVLVDFSVVDDTIRLENAIFSKLTSTGPLAAGHFRASGDGKAGDDNDFILYNTATGALFYDADGNGAIAAVRFATVGATSHPALTAADFVVV